MFCLNLTILLNTILDVLFREHFLYENIHENIQFPPHHKNLSYMQDTVLTILCDVNMA